MTDYAPHFVDDRHALYVGAVMGIAMKHGILLEPEGDAEGNYTDRLTLRIAGGVRITFVVPPPPDDWTIDSWADDYDYNPNSPLTGPEQRAEQRGG